MKFTPKELEYFISSDGKYFPNQELLEDYEVSLGAGARPWDYEYLIATFEYYTYKNTIRQEHKIGYVRIWNDDNYHIGRSDVIGLSHEWAIKVGINSNRVHMDDHGNVYCDRRFGFKNSSQNIVLCNTLDDLICRYDEYSKLPICVGDYYADGSCKVYKDRIKMEGVFNEEV